MEWLWEKFIEEQTQAGSSLSSQATAVANLDPCQG
ncbi:hypothetical protein EVA_12215 [gut metagenome]|uniref:Uncharacterized protein n=1 Tax=gut metagenome TaxID=749906 RepID=J9FYM7_9ZZZZ